MKNRIRDKNIKNLELKNLIDNNEEIIFIRCTFVDNIDINSMKELKKITFNRCNFKNHIILRGESFNYIHIIKCTFESMVDFINLDNLKEIKIVYSLFKEYSSFKNIKVNSIHISITQFFEVVLFMGVILSKVNFKATSFTKRFEFHNVRNDKNDELNIINLENRETSRIIKDSFEQQNNIIEANKFYALEMEKREKELDWNKDFVDWLVFKFHGLSSNHSQSWILALFWIVIFGLFASYLCPSDYYTFSKNEIISKEFFLAILISTSSIFSLSMLINFTKEKLTSLAFFISLILYIVFTKDIYFNNFANTLNPFSIMTGKENLTFGTLIFKIIIAYLIYQFIISIRQNTRRK